jgi:hypothetical protein
MGGLIIFAISVSPDTDGFAGMAANFSHQRRQRDASTFVILDILNTGATTAKPLDRVVIASVAQRWLMDQLTGNIVAVTPTRIRRAFHQARRREL